MPQRRCLYYPQSGGLITGLFRFDFADKSTLVLSVNGGTYINLGDYSLDSTAFPLVNFEELSVNAAGNITTTLEWTTTEIKSLAGINTVLTAGANPSVSFFRYEAGFFAPQIIQMQADATTTISGFYTDPNDNPSRNLGLVRTTVTRPDIASNFFESESFWFNNAIDSTNSIKSDFQVFTSLSHAPILGSDQIEVLLTNPVPSNPASTGTVTGTHSFSSSNVKSRPYGIVSESADKIFVQIRYLLANGDMNADYFVFTKPGLTFTKQTFSFSTSPWALDSDDWRSPLTQYYIFNQGYSLLGANALALNHMHSFNNSIDGSNDTDQRITLNPFELRASLANGDTPVTGTISFTNGNSAEIGVLGVPTMPGADDRYLVSAVYFP